MSLTTIYKAVITLIPSLCTEHLALLAEVGHSIPFWAEETVWIVL